MKILQINNHHSLVGGAETIYFNTIKLLVENGHEVVTFSRYNDDTIPSFRNEYFVKYSSSYLQRFQNSKAAESLNELLLKEKPDIAHIHNIVGGVTFSILPVLKKHHIPTIMSIHDFRLKCPVSHFMDKTNLICERCKNGSYYHCILKNCSPEGLIKSISIASESYLRDYFFPYYCYVDTFIFVSDFVRNKFIDINPRIGNKSKRIYSFTLNFQQNPYHENYFLYMGRLAREKGLLTLLEAFKSVDGAKLKIVGDGPFKDLIQNRSKGYSNIEILGYKSGSELKKLLSAASFVIVPSECYETLSMAAIEAFAFGKPVIGTNIGALAELIEPGKNGFLFEPHNILMLKEIIMECNTMPLSNYVDMSNYAFEKGKEKFSSEKYYQQLIETYSETIH